MPYQTVSVDAELYLTHAGVSVYHTYKDDDAEQPSRTFWFVLCPDMGEDDAFDVRELESGPEYPAGGNQDDWIKATIIAAIDSGELKAP